MHVAHPHHTETNGFLCPGKEHTVFVTPDHFLDRHAGAACYFGHPQSAHTPAVQVIDIYVASRTPRQHIGEHQWRLSDAPSPVVSG